MNTYITVEETIGAAITVSSSVTTIEVANVTVFENDNYLLKTEASTTYEPIKGSDDNYVTDAEKVIIGNTSGTNTGDQDLSAYAKLDDNTQVITNNDSIVTTGGTINRDVNGDVSSIEYDNRTVTITRSSGLITSYTDGTNTWTITRDVNDIITGWTVS